MQRANWRRIGGEIIGMPVGRGQGTYLTVLHQIRNSHGGASGALGKSVSALAAELHVVNCVFYFYTF